MRRRGFLVLCAGLLLAGCGGGGGSSRQGGGGGDGPSGPPRVIRISPNRLTHYIPLDVGIDVTNIATKNQADLAEIYIGRNRARIVKVILSVPPYHYQYTVVPNPPGLDEIDTPLPIRVVFRDGTEAEQVTPPVTMTWASPTP